MKSRKFLASLGVLACVPLVLACGGSADSRESALTVPESKSSAGVKTQTGDTNPADSWAEVGQCARNWNQLATDRQLSALALAAIVDPVRRDRKASAWVDRWQLQSGSVSLIGPGMRGKEQRLEKGACVVASGPDVGGVFVLFGRRWEQVSGDAPTERLYPIVMMAQAGGNSYIRRDGTVLPIVEQHTAEQ